MVIIMKYVLTVSCTKNLKSTTTLSLSRKISDYICKKYNIIELGVLNLAEKKIEYCSGCGCCFSHGFCPLDEIDDMKFIKEVFLKADIITIVVPVYAYNVPGIMKSLMDRLASWNHILNLTGKKIMVFTLTHISGAQYVCNYVSNIFSFKQLLPLGFQLVQHPEPQGAEAVKYA